MVKAIVWDFAGVVVEPGLGNWFAKHMPGNEEEKILLDICRKGDLGEVDLDGYYSLVSKETGIPKELIYETIFAIAPIHNGVVELIKKLKDRYKIVLFSNNNAGLVDAILEEKRIKKLFDKIIVSSDFKLLKPGEEFFIKLLEILRLDKNEVILIDDNKDNVDGGNAFGIQSVLYESPESLKELEHRLIAV